MLKNQLQMVCGFPVYSEISHKLFESLQWNIKLILFSKSLKAEALAPYQNVIADVL